MKPKPHFSEFTVLDTQEFPLVWSLAETMAPGYAVQWEREMDALIAHGMPFVSLMAADAKEEAHEDRKQRSLWLKRNKLQLRNFCRGVVGIEPNDVKRAAMQAQAAMMSKAMGVPMAMVESAALARSTAQEMLSQG